MVDRSFYARFYAVSFTELKKSRTDLSQEELVRMALNETRDRYLSDLEKRVLNHDLSMAYITLQEYHAFLKDGGFAYED